MFSPVVQRGALRSLWFVLLFPVMTSAQEPLQLNVPYHCEDGVTRIITRCASNPRGEVCSWREEKNGQLIVERYNVRGQMDGWLKTCKVQAATAPQPASAPTGPLNPAYLAGFPDVERVKHDIHGTDGTDTVAHQMAVLDFLQTYIRRMQMAPGRPYGSVTPDEQRLMSTYAAAETQLQNAYIKSDGPDAARTLQNAVGRYSFSNTLGSESLALLSPATQAELRRVNGAANAHQQEHVDQIRRQNEQAQAQAAAAANGNSGSPFVRNDPGTLAVRRCLELGGGDMECMGKGFVTGLFDMSGVNVKTLAPPSVAAGVRMGGTYKTATGLALAFSTDTVVINPCGKLVPEGRGYKVTKRGDQLDIAISNASKPLVVTLGPDGRITGPATFDVDGKIIVGYRKYWVESRRVSDNSIVPGSGHEVSEPVYGPKTERCAFAALRATAPVESEPSLVGSIVGIVGGEADPAAKHSGTMEAPAGARLIGKYAGSGLQLEFHPTAVVIDCGQAHVLRPYTVALMPDRVAVTLRNGATLVSLALRPDGTLQGAGNIDVAGRTVTGVNDTGATFAPKNARCNVAALMPQQ